MHTNPLVTEQRMYAHSDGDVTMTTVTYTFSVPPGQMGATKREGGGAREVFPVRKGGRKKV